MCGRRRDESGVGGGTVKVAAVDIGTNSMRLLISDGVTDFERREVVTGLGRGVDRHKILSEEAIARTIPVLIEYGQLMEQHEVTRRMAIATSASRDALNREEFFDAAGEALGVRPTLISGDREARLAYVGATSWFEGPEPVLVSDIGGGSTELVSAEGGVSVDIGSVRLTERALPDHPATEDQVDEARALVRLLFNGVYVGPVGSLVGVAGTWTELPTMARGLGWETDTHGLTISLEEVSGLIDLLAGLSLDEKETLGTLNPKRAPVILGGVLVAEAVMEVAGVESATVSVHDTLDGVVAELLALR